MSRRAQLERLRGVGRDQGPEGQRSALEDLSVKAVRDLAQAAGLRVRKDGTATWLRGDELREALLEHLAPQGSAAPEEFAAFVLCFVFFPRASERRVLLIVGVCQSSSYFSHLHIFTSTHIILSFSHLHI